MGQTKDILDPFDIQQKMTAFGFYTEKVPGADMQAIDEAIERCKASKTKRFALSWTA